MVNATNINRTKRIAFAVHNNNKAELIEWSYFNKCLLQQHDIIASGDAANILGGTLDKIIVTFTNGPMHGYEELSNLIKDGKVDILILFWNTSEAQMQKNGIKKLLHAALDANTVIAHNKVTADFILNSTLMHHELVKSSDCYTMQPVVNETINKGNAA